MENRLHTPESAGRGKRISIACKRCRERKLRCDGSRPVCQGCLKGRSTCEYRNTRLSRNRFVMQYCLPLRGDIQGSSSTAVQLESPKPSKAAGETATAEKNKASSELRPIRIPFFRWFGPTGIAPGYKKMLFDVRQSNQSEPDVKSVSEPLHPEVSEPMGRMQAILTSSPLFEADNITPKSSILYPLLDTFFDYYGGHFPFYSRHSFTTAVKAKKVSALLLNSICGLAARFSDLDELQNGPLYLRGEIFAEKAKFLLVPLLNLPSYETVASMLMIVWLELASNHDVGVWMYMGITCRMAVDLGMEKAAVSGPERVVDPQEYWIVSNLFWAVNFLDHIISFATGRPITIQPEHIDVPYPPSSPPHGSSDDVAEKLPSPFLGMIVVIQTLGLMNTEINISAKQSEILPPATKERLKRYGDELVEYYANLHPSLTFNIHNFQAHAVNGDGGTFLLLHLWFNAIMIAIHRPALRYGKSVESNNIFLNNESRGVALSSARTISSILSLGEVVDLKSFIASPFADQAIEMAGLVFIAESLSTSDTLKKLTNRVNYDVCLRALQGLLIYWKGVGWLTATMEQKSKGMVEIDPGEASVDPQSLINVKDTKMIQKLLEKVETATSNSAGNLSSNSICIGLSGTTSYSGLESVMCLPSATPGRRDMAVPQSNTLNIINSTAENFGSDNMLISQSTLLDDDSWASCLEPSFWENLDVPINEGLDH